MALPSRQSSQYRVKVSHRYPPTPYSPCPSTVQSSIRKSSVFGHLFLPALLDPLGSGIEGSLAALCLGSELSLCFSICSCQHVRRSSAAESTYQLFAFLWMRGLPRPIHLSGPSLVALKALPFHLSHDQLGAMKNEARMVYQNTCSICSSHFVMWLLGLWVSRVLSKSKRILISLMMVIIKRRFVSSWRGCELWFSPASRALRAR